MLFHGMMNFFFFIGIMTGAFYSVSTLLNQMILTHYEVSFVLFSETESCNGTLAGLELIM